ncbi:ABC transporter substrate-binding protein [Bradyrhizobium sp. AS23.2]|uniref:ABC transporter substrate-binding protein n=1 Tax=Bradyrhizobium sp. AS23.2 TaxID=1680155 RepID=UPI00093C1E45|nr:ABC transporter substrate-binding protein [Bradyrhizobium sp. AS23.2]OKO83029.1 branched-chain amino acid ABC transporter substrate-binding protein [Bradyrhizobium sp. AS23.2]
MNFVRHFVDNAILALVFGTALATTAATGTRAADMPGVTATEIRIGNAMPYSGPASAYSIIAKTEQAYFDKINAEGGINGRKIKFLSYDDAYSPPKTVEQVRKLVESDDVLLVFQTLGTPPSSAVHKYLNQKKVPQLLTASGAAKFTDPKRFPWTMGWNPTLENEGQIYGRYILANHAGAKVGVLYQNDDYGREVLNGLRSGLGKDADKMIVAAVPYETSDPTVDSQVVKIKSAGADVFVNVSTTKAAAQAIRKIGEMGWKPVHILNSVANSVGAVLEPAGLEASTGILSAGYLKDPTDPTWDNAADRKEWEAFMDKHFPSGDKTAIHTVYGYAAAHTLVQILKQCGDDLSRENVMRQAANLKDFVPPMLLPGSKINTTKDDYAVIRNMQMMRFDGKQWKLFGDLL